MIVPSEQRRQDLDIKYTARLTAQGSFPSLAPGPSSVRALTPPWLMAHAKCSPREDIGKISSQI